MLRAKVRTEPYFVGQLSCPCGHYYPDTMRVRDERKKGQFVRIISCIACGEYEMLIAASMFGGPETCEAVTDEVREQERVRLLTEDEG